RRLRDLPDKPKVLVFAGFPGLAPIAAASLRRAFGTAAVVEFRFDLDREEKEDNVRRFRDEPGTWILVSDETGGEGRNFQFADRLVHLDTPWYVARVEQRIGRLDRLGREQHHPSVLSCVVFNSWTEE